MVAKTIQANSAEIYQRIVTLWKDSECTVSLDEAKAQKLTELVMLLCKWNQALNLTAIRDPMEMVVLHILDSMSIEPYIFGKNVADVGTGPGFPGLVLAILHPEIHFTLIDSIAKKISFVKNAVNTLKLENVTAVNGRCESISVDEPFVCIVSRAFAPLERIVTWCRSLLAPDGKFVAMKGNLSQEERDELPQDAVIEQIAELHVPGLDAKRQAVIVALH